MTLASPILFYITMHGHCIPACTVRESYASMILLSRISKATSQRGEGSGYLALFPHPSFGHLAGGGMDVSDAR